WNQYLDGYNQQWGQIVSDFHTALRKGQREIQTNADGRFEAKVSPGKYVLYTRDITVQQQRLAWGEVIDATTDIDLSLNQKSAAVVTGAWQDQLLYRLESRLVIFIDATPSPREPTAA